MVKMTVDEISQIIEQQVNAARGNRETVIFRPTAGDSFIEVDAKLVGEALNQVKRAITELQCGLKTPDECKAEALLLKLFDAHALASPLS